MPEMLLVQRPYGLGNVDQTRTRRRLRIDRLAIQLYASRQDPPPKYSAPREWRLASDKVRAFYRRLARVAYRELVG